MASAADIVPFLDFSKPYLEPFCGSAAFFFVGSPDVAILNDNNKSLIDFYKDVQVSPEALWTNYASIPITEASYYEYRDRFNRQEQSIERSAMFMYLNHFCFNGIYRTNKKGQFNTPFGAKKKVKQKITLDEMLSFSQKISSVEFSCLDFEIFIQNFSPKDSTIYFDPPYFTRDVRVFGEYASNCFGGEDLLRLKEVAHWCANRNNRVVISYKECTEFKDIFGDHIADRIEVRRNVGGFAGRRKHDYEVIAVVGGRNP